jgi:hypothetical protein
LRFAHASSALLVASVLLASSGAAAAQDRYGSSTYQTARFCRDAPNGGGNIIPADVSCFTGNPDTGRKDTRSLGGEGIAIDSTSNMTIGGQLVSKVEFGLLDLPTVKSGAWAASDTRLLVTSATWMAFTFTGSGPTPYALDAVIDWTGSGAPRRAAEGSGEFGGEGNGVFFLKLVDSSIVPAFTDANAFNSFVLGLQCGGAGVLSTTGVELLSASAGYAEASITLGTGCGGGALMVEPGKEYMLLTLMQAAANRDGYFDATNTIQVKLSETLSVGAREALVDNVVTARSLVPEPASWAMMLAGFGLVGAIARRRGAALA